MKSSDLFIYPDSQLTEFSWVYINQGKPGPVEQGDRQMLDAWLDNHLTDSVRTLVVLPVEVALHTVVTIPRKQRRFLSRSLPFVLEAQTAQDIDDLHIVPDHQRTGDQVGVYAIPHRTMANVLALQAHPRIVLNAVVLDSQILAAPSMETVRIAWQEDRILVSRRDAGMACQRQDVSLWLERLIPDAEPSSVSRYEVLVGPEHETSAESLLAELVQSGQAVVDAEVTSAGWLPMLVDLWLQQAPPTNLLAGPYEQADRLSYWKRYRPVAVWAGLLVAVSGLFFVMADLRQQEARAEALWAATESLYNQAMPDEMRFDRRTAQQTMTSVLDRRDAQSPDQSAFLNIMDEINTAMESQNITLEEIRYTGGRQEVQLQVTASSTDSLETFRSRLESGSLQATYSAGSVSGGFRGNFRIQRSGGS